MLLGAYRMCVGQCGQECKKNEVLSFFPFPFHFDLFQKLISSIIFSFPWRNRAPRAPLLPPNVTAPRAALLQHA